MSRGQGSLATMGGRRLRRPSSRRRGWRRSRAEEPRHGGPFAPSMRSMRFLQFTNGILSLHIDNVISTSLNLRCSAGGSIDLRRGSLFAHMCTHAIKVRVRNRISSDIVVRNPVRYDIIGSEHASHDDANDRCQIFCFYLKRPSLKISCQ